MSGFGGKATNKSTVITKPIKPGNYAGYLIGVIDLGTHDDSYMGDPKPDSRSICLAFELPAAKDEDGKPNTVISEVYPVYIKDGEFIYGKKNRLRLMLENWRGSMFGESEDIDPTSFLGKGCLVSVKSKMTGKGKLISVIGSVNELPEGMTPPPKVFDPVAFLIDDKTPPDLSHLPFVFAGTPKQMQSVDDVIKQSKESRGIPIGQADPAAIPPSVPGRTEDAEGDDTPF